MKKPSYAIAMELRKADKELEAKFQALPNWAKWKWLEFACAMPPFQSLEYIHDLANNIDDPSKPSHPST